MNRRERRRREYLLTVDKKDMGSGYCLVCVVCGRRRRRGSVAACSRPGACLVENHRLHYNPNQAREHYLRIRTPIMTLEQRRWRRNSIAIATKFMSMGDVAAQFGVHVSTVHAAREEFGVADHVRSRRRSQAARRLREVAQYAARHGSPAAVLKYGVSRQRIHQIKEAQRRLDGGII